MIRYVCGNRGHLALRVPWRLVRLIVGFVGIVRFCGVQVEMTELSKVAFVLAEGTALCFVGKSLLSL